MKKWLFLLPIIILLIVSCSSDSSTDPVDDTPMVSDDEPVISGNPVRDFPGNFLPTGDSGADILANDNFTNLEIQIAFVQGFRPTEEAMQNFETYLREFSFKQEITVVYTELESPGEETLTLEEISDLELDNRTSYNDDDTLAIYIYFADAPSDGDDPDSNLVTLGAVYRNTSMVIFEETIRDLAAQFSPISTINRSDVETATLNHEFGHLFGLVNLGTAMVNPHEDEEAANHCNVEGCLMRAELQFSNTGLKASAKGAIYAPACQITGHDIIKALQTRKSNAETVDLDTECRLDIEAIGARITSTTAKEY